MLCCSIWFSASSFWMGGAFCTLFYLVASSWHFTLFQPISPRLTYATSGNAVGMTACKDALEHKFSMSYKQMHFTLKLTC